VLLLVPLRASGAELRSAYSIPISGAEGEYAYVALGGHTLVVARSNYDRVDLHDARTGALTGAISCPGPDDDAPFPYGPPCNARPQASRRLLAFALGSDIDLYDHAGRFRRQLQPGGAGGGVRPPRHASACRRAGRHRPSAGAAARRAHRRRSAFEPAVADGAI
jgi:hypothetical protein